MTETAERYVAHLRAVAQAYYRWPQIADAPTAVHAWLIGEAAPPAHDIQTAEPLLFGLIAPHHGSAVRCSGVDAPPPR